MQTNPITGYRVTLLPGTPERQAMSGWVRLVNGENDAGFVHIQDERTAGIGNASGEHPYVITAVRSEELPLLLQLLDSGPELQIRIEGTGSAQSVFIEPVGGPDTP